MSKKKPGVKFQIESDDGDSSPGSEKRSKNDSLKKDSKKTSVKSENSKKNKATPEEHKSLELMKFLKSEKRAIVRNPKMIDDEERELLEQSGRRAIDLDGLLKFKEPKAKDKLWKIPYSFKDDQGVVFPEGEPSTINRFGTGINDGCFVSLTLPTRIEKKKRDWDDINREADQVCELFETAKMSRLTRTRRGSILQPTHVYLTPNPETGHTEYILGHSFLTMRSWQSEFQLNSGESQELLATEFKEHICENISMDNLDNIPFADAGGGISGSSHGFRDSEIQFIQAVQNRRRTSLMPPKAGGNFSDLAFQRASFAGGSLWSPNLERARRKAIYHEKVKLVNPDYTPPDENTDDDDDDEDDNDEEEIRDDNENDRNAGDDGDCDDDDEDDDENTQKSSFKFLRKGSIERTMKKNSIQGKRRSRSSKAGIQIEEQYYPELNSGDRIRAKMFGHELTLIVRQHFIAIKESEIVNFITHSGQHVLNACPNIKALLHFQNRVIRLISTFILKHDELDERVDAILFFLETMRQLYLLGNWHSVNLVAQSLQCPPVVRLKETWRRITFQHQEDYCYFMEMSEHLRMGKECVEYETLSRFLPLFDDVLDTIREKCGLKLILIQQNRQQASWVGSGQSNIVSWVHDEVEDLKESVQRSAKVNGTDAPKDSSMPKKKKPIKLNFFRRFLFCAARPEQVSNRRESAEPVEYFEPARQQADLIQLDENSNQQLLNSNNLTKMPSCKKFWSIADYNKLSAADKELIKQEIVRTLVAFQKTAFYVFEDRDPELRDFLLNCRCESMDANMKRSREVENETTKSRVRSHDSQCSVNSSSGIAWTGSRGEIDEVEAEQFLESRHGNRRVMFALDFDEDEPHPNENNVS